jgi:hypothetical protein
LEEEVWTVGRRSRRSERIQRGPFSMYECFIERMPDHALWLFLQHEFAPRGELWFIGGTFTLLFTPRGVHYLLFRRTDGRTEGYLGYKVHPCIVNYALI